MLHALVAFLPVAAALALSPGPATAMEVHTAARGGRRGRPFRRAGSRRSAAQR
jgi:threonine/homoserine/homoserine lactone efflux protein